MRACVCVCVALVRSPVSSLRARLRTNWPRQISSHTRQRSTPSMVSSIEQWVVGEQDYGDTPLRARLLQASRSATVVGTWSCRLKGRTAPHAPLEMPPQRPYHPWYGYFLWECNSGGRASAMLARALRHGARPRYSRSTHKFRYITPGMAISSGNITAAAAHLQY